MPYAFAHPAAVIPLARLLGGRAVPSALAIGSIIPDAWYLVPLVERGHSHGVPGALWFCLPAGLIVYAAFHLLFKEPMLALLPRSVAGRLAAWSTPGVPQVRLRWVVLSLLAGVATHLAWDACTHQGTLPALDTMLLGLHRVLQHASTLLGAAFLAWWVWRKLGATPPQRAVPEAPLAVRIAVLATLSLLPTIAFLGVLSTFEAGELRAAVRAAGTTAVSAMGLLSLCFCLAWRWRPRSWGRNGLIHHERH